MKAVIYLSMLAVSALLTGCSPMTATGQGFSLPDGDAENGQIVFIELRCIECHTLAGTDMSAEQWQLDSERELAVELGGETTRVKTYAELVTSIINPSHRIAKGYPREQLMIGDESRMSNYNDIMRVGELVDLVTFLKSKYELRSVPLTTYPYYIYPG